MDNSSREVIGLIAAALTIVAFLLPVIRIVRIRSVQSLPLATMIVAFLGAVLWFVYGLILGSLSIIVASVLMALLVAFVLALKFRSDSSPL